MQLRWRWFLGNYFVVAVFDFLQINSIFVFFLSDALLPLTTLPLFLRGHRFSLFWSLRLLSGLLRWLRGLDLLLQEIWVLIRSRRLLLERIFIAVGSLSREGEIKLSDWCLIFSWLRDLVNQLYVLGSYVRVFSLVTDTSWRTSLRCDSNLGGGLDGGNFYLLDIITRAASLFELRVWAIASAAYTDQSRVVAELETFVGLTGPCRWHVLRGYQPFVKLAGVTLYVLVSLVRSLLWCIQSLRNILAIWH